MLPESVKPPEARPAKIAFYIHSMFGGGAERVFALLASGFAARGYDVDLVLKRAEGPQMKYVANGARTVSLDCGTARALPRLLAYLRREKPDCLIAGLSHNNLVAAAAARLSATPFVATVHSIPSAHKRNFRTSQAFGTVAEALAPLVYRSADAVGVVSAAVARDIAYYGKRPDKFRVLYNPVNTDHFRPLDAGSSAQTAATDEPTILALGRFDRAKNFALLLRAFALLVADTPARLVLLGDGPERERLSALAGELGIADRVAMPGFVVDPLAHYHAASVVALTSRYEGFGNTLAEAMATGTPVVATDCIGAPREVLEDGRFGSLVPVEDARALAAALARAIRRPPPPERLIARARDFSLDKCLDRYEAMLEEVILGRRKPAARQASAT